MSFLASRVSEDTSRKLFDEKACVESEPHVSVQKLKELMEENDGLGNGLQLMQIALQRVDEEKVV